MMAAVMTEMKSRRHPIVHRADRLDVGGMGP